MGKINPKNNPWITIAIYFGVILSFGLFASMLSALLIPEAKIDLPSPGTTGIRANLVIGACVAMLVCPVCAGIRCWNIGRYLISSTLALGLLSVSGGNATP